jgi:diguanylate cyclase (GGDEF)-like protein
LSDSAVAARRAFDRAREIRRRFLIVVLSASLVWSGLLAIGAVLGWTPLGAAQTSNNLAYCLVTVALLAGLVLRPRALVPIAIVVFATTFPYVAAAQLLVPEDQLRMLLFYPLAGAGFLILGSVAGWVLVIGAFASFATAYTLDLYELTPLAASTFVITLALTGAFFQVFQVESDTALRTISGQNVELEAAARQDALTGLMNRRALQENLQGRFVSHTRPPQRPREREVLSLAFVDVDRFKEINDRFGHAAGDAVLAAIADVLRAVLDRRDAVAARIGGEEFAILLPGAHLTEALAVSEAVRTAVASADLGVVPDLGRVTVSIGVASSQSGLDSADAILRAADTAMYLAKRDGRDRVVVWTG